MTRYAFAALVDEALATIPPQFRDAMQNIAIVIEDEPTSAQLADVDLLPDDGSPGSDEAAMGATTLLGLYEGTPLTERQWGDGNRLPDKITLFQRPIEDASEDEDDLIICVGETLIHEIGHYFGLSEDEIEAIEEKYWRGEA